MKHGMYSPLFNPYLHHEAERDKLYQKLYNLPGTCHLDIPIASFHARTSYPAFFFHTEDIDRITERIQKLKKELDERWLEMTDRKREETLRCLMKKEIECSAAIEGIECSEKELCLAENALREGKEPVPFSGIVKAYEQLIGGKEFAFDTCEDIRAFYNDFILDDILRRNPENFPDGYIFRKDGVEITYGNKIRHKGTYPEALIIEYTEKALQLKNSSDWPLLIRLAAFLFLFGYIQPFYDGTGLTARFIAACHITREISPFAAFSFSPVLLENKDYCFHLYENTCSTANRGCLTGFIVGFLETMELASEKALEEI